MAENVLEDFKCAKCSSAVRTGSLFCFHCGAAIEPLNKNKGSMSDAWFKETIVEGQEDAAIADPIAGVEAKTVVPEVVSEAKQEAKQKLANETVFEERIESKVQKDADIDQLKSAASIRSKPKSISKKSVEVVWEEPEGSTIAWFIVAVIVLVAIAVGLIFAAWYLR